MIQNNNQKYDILLASASPRRLTLMRQLGWCPEVCSVDLDETARAGELPRDYCLRMALEKSLMAAQVITTNLPIVTADTIVALDEQILGKPKDTADATFMLKQLSDTSHQVYSAVSVLYAGKRLTKLSSNTVQMATISEAQIRAYVASGDATDKAGAYGIQGVAAMWIKKIEGSYSSIMGLPLYETTALLKELAIMLPLDRPKQ